MKGFKKTLLTQLALLFLLVVTCAFACRNNAAEGNSQVSEEEILQVEKEAVEMDASKAEIDEATAKVDSLINDLEN